MSNRDPKGYYVRLGVSPTASDTEIKTAFRKRAMEVHPDRNTSPYAKQEFQELSEAYQILSEPTTRAQYDTIGIQLPKNVDNVDQQTPELIVCSSCRKVTAQPRYIIFYEVKSFIYVTIRRPIQGIFCNCCAEKKVFRATIVTWLLGWWGFPWGIIYSVQAIFQNLFGGIQPKDINARLLVYQAWAFASLGKMDIARAIALDALEITQNIQPKQASLRLNKVLGYSVEDEAAKLKNLITDMLSAMAIETPIKRFKNVWRLFGRSFYVQSGILILILAVLCVYTLRESPKIAPTFSDLQKPTYVRPMFADNGAAWPDTSGYISGYSQQFTDGHSSIEIDNLQNDSDVFVKLFSLNANKPMPIRVFFIRSREKFMIENIRAGKYDVRYRNLNSGRLSRSETFNLEELKTEEGIQFSKKITITLYKVTGGNMQTYPISEEEF